MGKYKVIATPSSSLEDKIKAHHSFLQQNKKEAYKKSEQYWTPKDWVEAYSHEEYTDKEKAAYEDGYASACSVMISNLCFWFPEIFKEEK
jgi:hypothetical protein